MAIQSREVYITGDQAIDRVLNRIANRLDVLEGLRPDQNGIVEIETDKDISTRQSTDFVGADEVSSMSAQSSDDVNITGGKIKITDDDDTVIHQFGED